jgi:hypothetical protein
VKLNQGGLIVVGIYVGFFLLAMTSAYLAHDPKSQSFFIGLGVMPGAFLVLAFSESTLVWLAANVPAALPTGMFLASVAIAYLIGCVLEKVIVRISPSLRRLDDRWFDRVHKDDR